MPEISHLFADYTRSFKSYKPIEPPSEIAARLGLPEDRIIKMDANENPYGVPPDVLRALASSRGMHIYPDPEQRRVRRLIAEYCGAPQECIVAGNGSDELLDLLCRAFLEPGDKALTFSPSFSYYSHVVRLNRGQLIQLPRNEEFGISLNGLNTEVLSSVKMVLLCSPNNPTGNMVEADVLEFFLRQNMLVVVDEAYFEFCGRSSIDLVGRHPNLVVLRTFSKMFALAGFRIGYGVMSQQVADTLMAIKPPYSVTVPAEEALVTALGAQEIYKKQVDEMIRTRDELIVRMTKIGGMKPFPSHANFILVKAFGSVGAEEIKSRLEKEGILVRTYSSEELAGYFRISVPTPSQAEIFCRHLQAIVCSR